MFKERLFYNKQ